VQFVILAYKALLKLDFFVNKTKNSIISSILVHNSFDLGVKMPHSTPSGNAIALVTIMVKVTIS
jgi:hypothetical protein